MKNKTMYSVRAVWRPYHAKKELAQTAIINAYSEKEALELFKIVCSFPEAAHISISEHESGIYTLGTRKML